MANTLRFKRGLVSTIPTALAGEPLFTTDTFDLYIGNGTTNTRFQKYIASGTTSQLLRGDGSLLTMPIVLTSPSNGQVLKYNGTSWVNDSDAGITGSGASGQVAYFTGATTQGGSNNLFWDATNSRLGVGTNTPGNDRLSVVGTGRFTAGLTSSTAFIQYAHYFYNGGGTNDIFASTTGNNAGSGNFAIVNTTNGGRLALLGASDSTIRMGNNTQTAATATNFVLHLATGNISINSSSDNGLRFQVTGDASVNGNTASYIAQLNQANTTAGASFGTIIRGGTNVSDTALRVQNAAQTANLLTIQGNGSLGLGTTLLTGYNVRISKTITGSAVAYGIDIDSAIQSDVTNAAVIYGTSVGTQATAFTLSNLFHYNATQGTFGAGSVVTSQFGFRVSSNMVGATNNYAFYGEIASGTGRWNLYMNGTAANYLNGNLLINTTSSSGRLTVNGDNDQIFINTSGSFGSLYFNVSGNSRAALYVTNTATRLEGRGSDGLYFGGATSQSHVRITSAGNVGVGTVTPTGKFHVFNDANSQFYFQNVGGSNFVMTGTNASFVANSTSGDFPNFIIQTAGTSIGSLGGNGTTNLYVGTATSTIPLLFNIGGTEGARVTATNRNFHIGTFSSDSGEKLQVNGTMRVTGASTFSSSVTAGGSGAFGIALDANTRLITASSGNTNSSLSFAAKNFAGTTALAIYGDLTSVFGNLVTINANSGGNSLYLIGRNNAGIDDNLLRFYKNDGTTLQGAIYARSNILGFRDATNADVLNIVAGNIGVGTLVPAYKLDVQGTLGVTGAATFSSSVGVGVTPSVDLHVEKTSSPVFRIARTGGTILNISSSITATGAQITTGSASPIGFGINGVIAMNLTTSSNLLIGTNTDTGERLQVSGTMRVSGASTLSGGITLGHTGGVAITFPGGQAFRSNGGIFIDYGNGGSGDLVFRRGAGVTNTLTLAVADGAATFSSSVTAGGNLLLTNGTASSIGAINLIRTGTSPVASRLTFGTDGTGYSFAIAKNQGGTITDLLTILDTGATTFLSSVRAAGFNSSGGNGYQVINSASNMVTALRPTGGGASIMSTNSNGLHIAVGTEASSDLIFASNNTERIRLSSNGFFSQLNATNPSASITDSYIQYSADVTAGNAAPHFRTENGAVIKLYQETTAVGNSIISLGGGNAVLDDTTFDGYTLRQIVKALRNQGILA